MDTAQTPTSKRDEVIDYLMSNYTEIFELNTENQTKLGKNLVEMSDAELIYELDILSEFRAKEKGIYQNALRKTVGIDEQVEKNNTPIPSLNF